MFAGRDGAQGAIVVADGAAIDGFRVKVIDAETVVLVGPKGAMTLALQQGAGARSSAAPPPAVILETETTKVGTSLGLLAIQRDSCARAGYLPGVRADSETRLRQVIGAIANLPGRQEGDITRNAPTKLIAFGLSAGLDDARRRPTGLMLDLARCRALDGQWKQTAGQYGLLL